MLVCRERSPYARIRTGLGYTLEKAPNFPIVAAALITCRAWTAALFGEISAQQDHGPHSLPELTFYAEQVGSAS